MITFGPGADSSGLLQNKVGGNSQVSRVRAPPILLGVVSRKYIASRGDLGRPFDSASADFGSADRKDGSRNGTVPLTHDTMAL